MTQRVETARRLRRNQADAERLLWFRLRDRRLNGWKFRRQMPINGYITDFCCPDGKLIVELDGSQHAEQQQQDLERTNDLEASGYLVLRYWNNDVMKNIDGVLEDRLRTIDPQAFEPPHPNPLCGFAAPPTLSAALPPQRGEGVRLSKPVCQWPQTLSRQ